MQIHCSDSTDASQLNLWAGEIKAETMKATDTDALVKLQRLIHKPNLCFKVTRQKITR